MRNILTKTELPLISHLHVFFLFSLLTLLRLSKAKSNMSLGKGHIALGNMWFILKYIYILSSKIMIEQTLYDFKTFRP